MHKTKNIVNEGKVSCEIWKKRPFYKSDEKTELSIGEISINNNEGNIKIILDSDLIPLFIENGDSEK